MTRLEVPSVGLLPDYLAALHTGWRADTRDLGPEEVLADGAAFVASRRTGEGTITLDDGRTVARVPGPTRWIYDDGFAGSINLRFVAGTEELPDFVSGHIGYRVVPWREGRGVATRALGLMLALARSLGLARVKLTSDPDNAASVRVIEKNGGAPAPDETFRGGPKRAWWIAT